MHKVKFGIVDSVTITHKAIDGTIKAIHELPKDKGLFHALLVKLGLRHNSITWAGMAEVAALILEDVGGTAFDYIAIGDDDTGANNAQTALLGEVARKAAVGTRIETDAPNDTAQLVTTFSSNDGLSGNDSICEVAVLNADTDGTMLLRVTYSPADNCDWDVGDSIEVTVKVQIVQGS